MSAKIVSSYGWAWVIKRYPSGSGWVLCHWAEPTRAMLIKAGKPSPEAVPVRVRLVPVR